MGIEQLIPDGLEPETEVTIPVAPLLWHWVYTPNERVVADEVLASGLGADQLFPLTAVVQKDKDGVVIVLIGDLPPPTEYLGVVWGVDLIDEEEGTRTFVRTWHMALYEPGNPLEVHWRQRAGFEPTVTIEAIERVKKTTDVAKYAAQVARLLPLITNHLKPRGRPKDSTAYSKDEAIARIKETERLFGSGKYTREQAAAIAFDQNNEESAMRMYTRYKDRWMPD